MTASVLCRYGELFLKGANRSRFESFLHQGVRRALDGLPGASLSTPHGRVLAEVRPEDLEDACRRLERVFGLVSLSPAARVPPDMTAVVAAAVAAARAALERDARLGRSFRVEARRSDKRFPLTSQDIAREAGARIAAATAVPVDLEHPALTVGIEIGSKEAYVFTETRPAPGGLPVGSSGRGLLLLSGGIDSPVAGWLAAKRGLALDAVYFHSPPFVGEKTKDKVVALGRVLARWQALRAIHVAAFTDVQQRLRATGPAELAVVLYRRMMMRVADRIADRLEAAALVTGDNLGQVASQTVPNLAAIEAAARRVVLRPLLTYDKIETVALARRIGSYQLSIEPYEDCCSLFVPKHPATAVRLDDPTRAEAGLDLQGAAAAIAEHAEEIRL